MEHALNWDQINPIRYHRYNDLTTVLPELKAHFKQRVVQNPEFVYLEDQVSLAQQTRELKELPLNEEARIALRESQEEQALSIENKRRKAKGEELLTSLEQDDEADEDELSEEHDIGEDDEDENDVLLTEAGNVLADVLLLKEQRYALHNEEEMAR